MTNSKQKGARYERELAAAFRDHGYTDSRRTAQFCGNTGDASDVVGLPGIHVEAKHQEQLRLYDWMAQAIHDAEKGGKNALPTVFFRKNGEKTMVCMRLDDWFKLYREWEASMAIDEMMQNGSSEV